MKTSYEALNLILDSIPEHIVVINPLGEIQYVNRSWSTFGKDNACNMSDEWEGVNYLAECDKAAAMGDNFGVNAGIGIRSVINKAEASFYFEYPCHGPDEQRWFMMRVAPLQMQQHDYFVISHQDITERKLVENKVLNLASIDGLTNIANRRTFDQFIEDEWRRCLRLKKPLCLAILDLDNFKILNDTYGHQAGDDCLIKVGALLKQFDNRPSDICARYGGEEFALVWGNTSLEQAKVLSNSLLNEIAALKIPNINSSVEKYLTASIGLAESIPGIDNDVVGLIARADALLFKAKVNGRNTLKY